MVDKSGSSDLNMRGLRFPNLKFLVSSLWLCLIMVCWAFKLCGLRKGKFLLFYVELILVLNDLPPTRLTPNLFLKGSYQPFYGPNRYTGAKRSLMLLVLQKNLEFVGSQCLCLIAPQFEGYLIVRNATLHKINCYVGCCI